MMLEGKRFEKTIQHQVCPPSVSKRLIVETKRTYSSIIPHLRVSSTLSTSNVFPPHQKLTSRCPNCESSSYQPGLVHYL